MQCHELQFETATAAANMALDFALLRNFPEPAAWRWRWYGWSCQPAFTFGYRQPYEAVLAWAIEQTGDGAKPDLCRRPTGGGIVDHRSDVTLAVVIPPSAQLFSAPPLQAYQDVHHALVLALRSLGWDCRLQPCGGPGCGTVPAAANHCFQQAEPGDIVATRGGLKLLGSAMKRTRDGLLLQSSLNLSAGQPPLNVAGFRQLAAENLMALAGADCVQRRATASALPSRTDAFAAEDWLVRRKLTV